jgi:hypothetical protein
MEGGFTMASKDANSRPFGWMLSVFGCVFHNIACNNYVLSDVFAAVCDGATSKFCPFPSKSRKKMPPTHLAALVVLCNHLFI